MSVVDLEAYFEGKIDSDGKPITEDTTVNGLSPLTKENDAERQRLTAEIAQQELNSQDDTSSDKP